MFDDVGIPAGDVFVARQVVAELYECVLRVARLGLVGEVSIEIARGKRAAEPGVIPEEKREEDQQEREEADEEISLGAGTFGAGGHASVIIALKRMVWVRWDRDKLKK